MEAQKQFPPGSVQLTANQLTERLIASYSCRELIAMGVVDILQTDINHVGGITALWKVGAMAHRQRRGCRF